MLRTAFRVAVLASVMSVVACAARSSTVVQLAKVDSSRALLYLVRSVSWMGGALAPFDLLLQDGGTQATCIGPVLAGDFVYTYVAPGRYRLSVRSKGSLSAQSARGKDKQTVREKEAGLSLVSRDSPVLDVIPGQTYFVEATEEFALPHSTVGIRIVPEERALEIMSASLGASPLRNDPRKRGLVDARVCDPDPHEE